MDLGHTQIAHSYQLECTATQQSVHHHPPQDLAADLSKRPWEHHKAGCCVMKIWQLRASEQPFSIRFPSFQMKINGYHWSHWSATSPVASGLHWLIQSCEDILESQLTSLIGFCFSWVGHVLPIYVCLATFIWSSSNSIHRSRWRGFANGILTLQCLQSKLEPVTKWLFQEFPTIKKTNIRCGTKQYTKPSMLSSHCHCLKSQGINETGNCNRHHPVLRASAAWHVCISAIKR